ncbi:hypothetical protein C8Q78DRAFT_1148313 [Trametes maxima]|nr:hypothetical protein C8Q78DRAFT_1148313 [Trametes maxima]
MHQVCPNTICLQQAGHAFGRLCIAVVRFFHQCLSNLRFDSHAKKLRKGIVRTASKTSKLPIGRHGAPADDITVSCAPHGSPRRSHTSQASCQHRLDTRLRHACAIAQEGRIAKQAAGRRCGALRPIMPPDHRTPGGFSMAARGSCLRELARPPARRVLATRKQNI